MKGKATARAASRSRIPGLTSFGEDARGGLYAVSPGGTLYRIAA